MGRVAYKRLPKYMYPYMEGNRVIAATVYAEVVDGILDEYAQKR